MFKGGTREPTHAASEHGGLGLASVPVLPTPMQESRPCRGHRMTQVAALRSFPGLGTEHSRRQGGAGSPAQLLSAVTLSSRELFESALGCGQLVLCWRLVGGCQEQEEEEEELGRGEGSDGRLHW